MIADLDFIDDSDGLTEKERFRKHFRFLKSLKEDTLLVIDNFDTTASRESLLSQFCELKCTAIFTTRKGYLTQNLAAICASAGNTKMAMLYYSQAENILKQHLSEEHPDLLSYCNQKKNLLFLILPML